MKKPFNLLIFWIAFSCSTQVEKQNSFYAEDITEEELYLIYGLEATPDVYSYLFDKLKNNKYFFEICFEKPISNYISIDISIEENKIVNVNTRHTNHIATLDSLIINNLLGDIVNFEFIESQERFYDFRIDITKLCNGPNFSPTPLKDNTLETQPIINGYLNEINKIIK